MKDFEYYLEQLKNYKESDWNTVDDMWRVIYDSMIPDDLLLDVVRESLSNAQVEIMYEAAKRYQRERKEGYADDDDDDDDDDDQERDRYLSGEMAGR